MVNLSMNRRLFLRTAASTTALSATSYARVYGANERVGLGLIGYGLIAQTHVTTFGKLAQADLVAIADCQRQRLHEGVEATGKRATPYADFRKLLEDKAVDAVIVATPDHWHALMALLACAAGKDVYVEKPLTLFIREGEWLQSVAARTKRIVQVGTQQRSGLHYAKARDLIRTGHIGTVTSVRMASVRNVYPGFGKPADGDAPADLDWDMWLGPAPARKYNPNRALYHFRWFWDTSGGQMTNLGAHHLDIVDWYLGLNGLKSVMSLGGRYALQDNGETPDTQDAIFDLGKYSATFFLREAAAGEKAAFGLIFYGTRGSLGIDRRGFRVTPDLDTPAPNLIPGVLRGHPNGGPTAMAMTGPAKPRTEAIEDNSGSGEEQYTNHARNFLECIKSRKTPVSDLASAQRTAIACHLANLSLRLGRSLRWDAEKQIIPEDKEAQALQTRPYRSPWDRELQALGVG